MAFAASVNAIRHFGIGIDELDEILIYVHRFVLSTHENIIVALYFVNTEEELGTAFRIVAGEECSQVAHQRVIDDITINRDGEFVQLFLLHRLKILHIRDLEIEIHVVAKTFPSTVPSPHQRELTRQILQNLLL